VAALIVNFSRGDARRLSSRIGAGEFRLYRLPSSSLHFLPAAHAGGNAGIPGGLKNTDRIGIVRSALAKAVASCSALMLAVMTTVSSNFRPPSIPRPRKNVLKLSTQASLWSH